MNVEQSPFSRLLRPSVWLVSGAVLAAALWLGLKNGALPAPMMWAIAIFLFGSAAVLFGTLEWLARIDHHALLRSEEKLQNKDALVIGAFFTLVLLLAYCITGAAAAMQFPERGGGAVLLALTWALASASVGGAFGFLLGHPRRLADEKPERTGLSGLLRTGLDDMVDWLVKGLTTVLLVQATAILAHLETVSGQMALGLLGATANETELKAAAAFAQPLIVSFTLLGALATCLVTRTYLTGALSRADRTTTGAFSRVGLDWGEVLLLVNAQRSLTSRDLAPGPEVIQVAQQLAALSLKDLHSVQEFAMWAKAKSMLGLYEEALKGYEKAVAECDCDPALLLDYAVVLHAANRKSEALARLQLAYEHLSSATAADTRKNLYKSLTFELLYQPGSFDRVIDLVEEYERDRAKYQVPQSGGLFVNEACAWGQKFLWKAQQKDLLAERTPGEAIKVNLPDDPASWPPGHQDLKEAYERALKAVKAAVALDPAWKTHLQLLLQSSHPAKAAHPDMNDLEVFERFNEFRFALDLPRFSETRQNPNPPSRGGAETTAGRQGKGSTAEVSTETAKLAPKDTGDEPPGV
jgi:tetratricopeptide (TPR) repeat protein